MQAKFSGNEILMHIQIPHLTELSFEQFQLANIFRRMLSVVAICNHLSGQAPTDLKHDENVSSLKICS